MATKKISELTALTSPDGAEELVVNDGGTSKKIRIDDLFAGDNVKANFGAGNDLQIYHDGSTSIIKDAGTGELQLHAENNLRLQNLTGSTYAKFTNGAQAELYYSGNLKLATTSTGIDVTGTVTADGLTGESTLPAISTDITDTAVDVFVYDTRKDSDGGAWRKRTQHTSWYNETLNTSTRGSRKEFPAVAVIVAESTQITIYDGDDPSLPMWMIRDFPSGFGPNSVVAADGQVCVGRDDAGLAAFNFPSAEVKSYRQQIDQGGIDSGGLVSGSFNGDWDESLPVIINNAVNDVAMTVLPNAPIDDATGLPVPTIAVATAGGVSVIKDDGTVVDVTGDAGASFSKCERISFAPDGDLLFDMDNISFSPRAFYRTPLPTVDRTVVSSSVLPTDKDFGRVETGLPVPLETNASGGPSRAGGTFYGPHGATFTKLNPPNPAGSMIAYTTSSYNTGWMNGDIKLATLSDTDDTDVTGSELVTNGTFDTDTSGWGGNSYGTPTLAVDTGRLKVTSDGTTYLGVQQALSGLSASKTYTATATVDVGTYTGNLIFSIPGSSTYSVNSGNAPSNKVVTFTFTGYTNPTIQVYMSSGHSSGDTFFVDNVSVRLAEPDRSVNGNGLQVHGTVTKSAVATGADLVAYSGFSSSNYLEQPYNSDLDFGTGDFCVMGWIYPTDSSFSSIISRGGNGVFGPYALSINGNVATFVASNDWNESTGSGSWGTIIANVGNIPSNTWSQVVATISGTTAKLYVNGELQGTDTSAVNPKAPTSNFIATTIGAERHSVSGDIGRPFSGSLALVRASATAPTAEQIAKIYEDEKVLFQENAKATLYGSSDAVTALAYDDDTNLLHVGTSAGRSDFQGLRRVDNTTTAVGAAISASNGMIAEE